MREKNQYRRKCSGQFEKWAVGCSPFFTSKEQSGLRVSADKERTQGALLRRGVFSCGNMRGLMLSLFQGILSILINRDREMTGEI